MSTAGGPMGMMSAGGAAGGGGAAGAGGAFWKMWDTIDEQRKYDRSRRDQKYFQNRQFEYQKMLDKYGHDLQFDMWNKTNYKAQLEHMKAAGLNPALMYGSAGAPGTTGSQGGGSAAGGQKPDSGAQGNFSMLTAQAQIEMMQSQANLNNAQAKKVGGVDTEGVKQQIAESVARESNLNAEEELKVQQKLNLISEKALTDERKKLEARKNEKKLTGSYIVDAMHVIGLDPIGNEEDMWIARGLIGLWLGKDYVKLITDMRKPKNKVKRITYKD